MDENIDDYVYSFVLLVSIIIVIIVIPRFYFYTPHGDIKNFYKEKINKVSNEKLLETLYELSIYDYCKVRWHYTFLLSLVVGIFLLYLIDSVSLKNIIIATLLLFIAIEIPGRLENGHIKNATVNKASIVYGTLNDRIN